MDKNRRKCRREGRFSANVQDFCNFFSFWNQREIFPCDHAQKEGQKSVKTGGEHNCGQNSPLRGKTCRRVQKTKDEVSAPAHQCRSQRGFAQQRQIAGAALSQHGGQNAQVQYGDYGIACRGADGRALDAENRIAAQGIGCLLYTSRCV